MKVFSWLFILLAFYFTSCTPQRAATNTYLLNVADTSGNDMVGFKQPLIKQGDLLSIRVYSAALGTVDEIKVDAPYNLTEKAIPQTTIGGVTTGFLVDPAGNVDYPTLGLIKAEGLTKEQLAEHIKAKLSPVLNQPTVVVRYLNYRVTVLGEVGSPSSVVLPTERVTILEALGLAGDITEFGRKDNVKVMRETNGKREIGTINLTSGDMLTSPYFQLQQNDVVFVEQTRRRLRQQDQQVLVQQIGIASSVITAVALILNFLK